MSLVCSARKTNWNPGKKTFWQGYHFLWFSVKSKLITGVVYWGSSLISFLPDTYHRLWTSHRLPLSYTPRLSITYPCSTLRNSSQSIKRDWTARVNKDLELEQGNLQFQHNASREEQGKWVGRGQAPQGLWANHLWSLSGIPLTASHCCLGFQGPILTLPSIGKVIQDGNCKQTSCTQDAVSSSGGVKMSL